MRNQIATKAYDADFSQFLKTFFFEIIFSSPANYGLLNNFFSNIISITFQSTSQLLFQFLKAMVQLLL